MADLSVLLIAFDNDTRLSRRVSAVQNAAAVSKLSTELIIVDNGSTPTAVKGDVNLRGLRWCGPAIEAALQRASADTFVYVCSQHLTVLSLDWLSKLIHPVIASGADLTGDLQEHGFGPAALGMTDLYDDSDPAYRVHVQGGVWAGRTEFLRDWKHCARFPHGYDDVVRSWWATKHGRVLPAPHIGSTGVRGQTITRTSGLSLVHDYREDQ